MKITVNLKVLLSLSALLVVGALIFWYEFIFRTNEEIVAKAAEEALYTTEIIGNSIKYTMMSNHGEVIQKVLENTPGSGLHTSIKVLDHKGNIKFSSDKNNLGKSIPADSMICKECHVINSGKVTLKDPGRNFFFTDKGDSGRTIKSFIPIKNESSCSSAACHVHPSDSSINGIIEAEFSLEQLDKKFRDKTLDSIIIGIIFLSLIAAALHQLLWRFVTKPAALISDGIKMAAKGFYGQTIDIRAKDEIGSLAHDYNEMIKGLQARQDELDEQAKSRSDILEQKSLEIGKAQKQYMYTEKLASLGRMAASVAHELNSPLTGIIVFARLFLKRVPPENKADQDDLKVIVEQAEKCSNIIAVLLGYSRTIPSENLTMYVNKAIENALNVLKHQARFYNITIEKEFDPFLPRIQGDQSQIEQVFINLLINASDAMNGKGKITIRTRSITEDGNDFVEIEFSDSGPGIPEGSLDKIFELFYTTKPEGKGTGLGLAVSKGIIQTAGGRIFVKSKAGEGANFFIHLPVIEV
ncbi:MAG: ATP-binding protein [Candidatus Magnetominusculus sp. LBB02]|nr:ATP-binding protein [Candidatus Magnetominusculus sp. LBB02]